MAIFNSLSFSYIACAMRFVDREVIFLQGEEKLYDGGDGSIVLCWNVLWNIVKMAHEFIRCIYHSKKKLIV